MNSRQSRETKVARVEKKREYEVFSEVGEGGARRL